MLMAMVIETKDLLEEFADYVKGNHPEFGTCTKGQIEVACKSFLGFLKDCMRRPELPRIRIMHFGIFQVKPGKALGVLRAHEKGLKGPRVQMPELIEERIKMLTNYLKKYAPQKLVPKQGKANPEEHSCLDSGELEVQTVLLSESADKDAHEKAHKGTDQFPDFLHGLSML